MVFDHCSGLTKVFTNEKKAVFCDHAAGGGRRGVYEWQSENHTKFFALCNPYFFIQSFKW